MSKKTRAAYKAKKERNKDLPRHYVMVRNERTNYTKLVKVNKAADMILGRYDYTGLRVQVLKDKYHEA